MLNANVPPAILQHEAVILINRIYGDDTVAIIGDLIKHNQLMESICISTLQESQSL